MLTSPDFVGASSTTHLAKRLNPGSTNFAWDVRPLYDDPGSLRRPVGGALPQLPPFEFAKRLFWVQYTYIGTIFSLIIPSEFEERLDLVYHQPLDFSNRESCLVYCQVLLVIAFGLMYSVNQWNGDDGPPGFKYFKHALRFLPDIHEEGSIFFVEVLCYVAYYMQSLNRRDAAFLYVCITFICILSSLPLMVSGWSRFAYGYITRSSSGSVGPHDKRSRSQPTTSDLVVCLQLGSVSTIYFFWFKVRKHGLTLLDSFR